MPVTVSDVAGELDSMADAPRAVRACWQSSIQAFLCWPHERISIESKQHGQTHQTVFSEVYDEQRIGAYGADSDGIRIIV